MQMTRYFKPYYSPILNNLDICSAFAALSSLVLGLFCVWRADSSWEGALAAVFIVLVLINVAYFAYWFLKIAPYIVHVFRDTFKYYSDKY